MITDVPIPSTSGSTPVCRHIHHDRYAPRISNAPWARLMTSMTPKINVNPDDINAYTPPMSTPKISVCSRRVMPAPHQSLPVYPPSLPRRLRVDDRLAGG